MQRVVLAWLFTGAPMSCAYNCTCCALVASCRLSHGACGTAEPLFCWLVAPFAVLSSVRGALRNTGRQAVGSPLAQASMQFAGWYVLVAPYSTLVSGMHARCH